MKIYFVCFVVFFFQLITYVKNEEDREPSEQFIKEWEKMMNNFVPEDIKTFMVSSYESEVVSIFYPLFNDLNNSMRS